MWPFTEPGLGVDTPPAADAVRSSIPHSIMATICWPESFPATEEFEFVPAGRQHVTDCFEYCAARAIRLEQRRKDQNWERRGVVLMCLLRRCGSNDDGAGLFDRAEKQKRSISPASTGERLHAAACIMLGLHKKEVATRAILAYL